MIEARKLRELWWPEGPLSAASGLVKVGDALYVVADDELQLGIFSERDPEPGRRLRLFEGELPGEARGRKAAKPDLESLALLPDGAMLAIPSGSTLQRSRGALVIGDAARPVDFSPILAELRTLLPDLNLEGAAVLPSCVALFSRGNGRAARNAMIRLHRKPFLSAVRGGTVPAGLVVAILSLELGALNGVRLCVTDAAFSGSGLVILAAAEAGEDTYEDGACVGSAVGWIEETSGRIMRLETLSPRMKAEGLWAEPDGRLLVVTDADDRETPAALHAIEDASDRIN